MICRRGGVVFPQATARNLEKDHTESSSTSTWSPETGSPPSDFPGDPRAVNRWGPEEHACSLVDQSRPHRTADTRHPGLHVRCDRLLDHTASKPRCRTRFAMAGLEVLLPAAATGRDWEQERLTVLLDCAWNTGSRSSKAWPTGRDSATSGEKCVQPVGLTMRSGWPPPGGPEKQPEGCRSCRSRQPGTPPGLSPRKHGDVFPAASSVAEVSIRRLIKAIGDACRRLLRVGRHQGRLQTG